MSGLNVDNIGKSPLQCLCPVWGDLFVARNRRHVFVPSGVTHSQRVTPNGAIFYGYFYFYKEVAPERGINICKS